MKGSRRCFSIAEKMNGDIQINTKKYLLGVNINIRNWL